MSEHLELCRSQLSDRNNAFAFADPITGHVDCNVAMTSQAIEQWDGASQLSAAELRDVAGQSGERRTGRVLARRCFAAAGMVAQADYRMLNGLAIEEVRELLRAGWFVTLFVDCGYLQLNAPELVGDRFYRGAHAVGLGDLWRGPRGMMVHLANPLFDGRTRGSWTAPKGVQRAEFRHLREAAYGYTGTELVAGWATAMSRPSGAPQ